MVAFRHVAVMCKRAANACNEGSSGRRLNLFAKRNRGAIPASVPRQLTLSKINQEHAFETPRRGSQHLRNISDLRESGTPDSLYSVLRLCVGECPTAKVPAITDTSAVEGEADLVEPSARQPGLTPSSPRHIRDAGQLNGLAICYCVSAAGHLAAVRRSLGHSPLRGILHQPFRTQT